MKRKTLCSLCGNKITDHITNKPICKIAVSQKMAGARFKRPGYPKEAEGVIVEVADE